MPGYSRTPLVRKLGIKGGSSLVLVNAPSGFAEVLVDLPDGVRIRTAMRGTPDLTVWFVPDRRELERRIATMAARMGQGLWIAWPKKASGVVTDVTGDVVRRAGLAHGLVDYKVCAITDVWSGLKFARAR